MAMATLTNSPGLHAPLQCDFVKRWTLYPHSLALTQFMPKPMGYGRNDVVPVVNFHSLSWPLLNCHVHKPRLASWKMKHHIEELTALDHYRSVQLPGDPPPDCRLICQLS